MRRLVRVEWDPEKDRKNHTKHYLSFDDVRPLFETDTDYLVFYDDEHSDDEDRFIAVGPIAKGVIKVSYTEPNDDVIRIISARMASRSEQEMFYKHARDRN
jgi:uncharacterized DUF497 family protein